MSGFARDTRALLVFNPKATATTPRMRDVLTRALGSELKVDVAETTHQHHATELAQQAAANGIEYVVVLGGDGTVNEVVNGLVHSDTVLAIVPAGSGNVFARALGMSASPIEATGEVIDAIRGDRRRTVNLGRADDRYFTFAAGLGVDAEIVHRVERQRHSGRQASPGRYFRTAVLHYVLGTDRRRAAVTLDVPGSEPVDGLFNGIVANGSPWTYFGERPVHATPGASFEGDLDLFALRRMTVTGGYRISRQFFMETEQIRSRSVLALHDVPEFTLRTDRPMAAQVDGDYIGERTSVTYRSVRQALTVVA
ncbi:MAG TPA: diacylglycerol kinase family protein [Mycobacteriales bacterium]|jgi:diacylglycerol kinase family enzyme|nr:diacylglycerol kinase family protein [Mycobacteriales bacterium]